MFSKTGKNPSPFLDVSFSGKTKKCKIKKSPSISYSTFSLCQKTFSISFIMLIQKGEYLISFSPLRSLAKTFLNSVSVPPLFPKKPSLIGRLQFDALSTMRKTRIRDPDMIYRKYNFIVLFCNTSNLSIPYTSTRAFQKTKGKEERRVRSLFCPLSFFRFKGRAAASPVVNPIPWIQRKGEKGFFCLESHRKTWNYCWRINGIKFKNEGNFPGFLHVEQI